MASALTTFKAKAPGCMKKLMADFGFSELDAAAVMGNAGHESGGLTIFQELRPRSGRGGLGWFQWTGSRRVAFEAYCSRNKLSTHSDDANYAFLFVELKGREKAAVAKTKAAATLNSKVVAFENAYERAGVKAYASRQKWAGIALAAYKKAPAPKPPTQPTVPPPAPPPPREGFFARLIRLIMSLFRKG